MDIDTALALAIEESAAARGVSTPNPPVGAVILAADGTVVGRGRPAPAGGPQAEVVALGLTVENRLPETVEVTPQGDSIKTPALPDPGWRTNAALEEPRADWAKFPPEWRRALGVVE